MQVGQKFQGFGVIVEIVKVMPKTVDYKLPNGHVVRQTKINSFLTNYTAQ